eukprot:gene57980-79426_t
MVFLCLGGWCHLKTMLSDPGVVPSHAKPLPQRDPGSKPLIPVCGICEAYKPPHAHHDRISSRCISRMDHFCPWMNNAIGAKNQKHFLLFLVYSDIAAGLMYGYLALQLVIRFFLTVELSFDDCLFSKLVPRYTQLLPDTLGLQELAG